MDSIFKTRKKRVFIFANFIWTSTSMIKLWLSTLGCFLFFFAPRTFFLFTMSPPPPRLSDSKVHSNIMKYQYSNNLNPAICGPNPNTQNRGGKSWKLLFFLQILFKKKKKANTINNVLFLMLSLISLVQNLKFKICGSFTLCGFRLLCFFFGLSLRQLLFLKLDFF